MGDYRPVIKEMLLEVRKSGLIDVLDVALVLVSGEKESDRKKAIRLIKKYIEKGKLEVIEHDFLLDYEFPTLNLLYKHCLSNLSDQVLYIHTKGVSKQSVFRKYWRRAMLNAVVRDYRICLQKLKYYDGVGFSWTGNHFCGNFWWVNADAFKDFLGFEHLRSNPVNLPWLTDSNEKDRLQCEFFWERVGVRKMASVGFRFRPDAIYIDPALPLDAKGDPFDRMGIGKKNRLLINMSHREDRLNQWQSCMKGAGVRTEYFRRIAGFPGAITQIHAKGLEHNSNRISGGATGCYISHMQAVQLAYEEGMDLVVIMEDDATPTKGFYEYLIEQWPMVPQDFDILWLGGYERHHRSDLDNKTEGVPGITPRRRLTDNLFVPSDVWGSHCYVLSRSGIEKIRNYLFFSPVKNHIDVTYSRHIENLVQYSFIPSLVKQNNMHSDIH